MSIRCEAEATHSVKTLVPVNDCTCERVEMFCGLRLCLKHASTIKISQVLPMYIREDFCKHLADNGGFNPDFEHAEIVAIPLNDMHMLMQEASFATIH